MFRRIFTVTAVLALTLVGSLLTAGPARAGGQGWDLYEVTGRGHGPGGYGRYSGHSGYGWHRGYIGSGGYVYRPASAYHAPVQVHTPSYAHTPAYVPVAPVVAYPGYCPR